MNRALRSLLIGFIPALLAGQEVPRHTDLADQNRNEFYTTHAQRYSPLQPEPNRIDKPYDMSEPRVEGVGRSNAVIRPEAWPEGTTFVEAKSLPKDLGVPDYDGNDTRIADGRRVFGLTLQPGEKVEFNLKAEADQVAMRAFVPPSTPQMRWKLELRNANQPLRSRRTKHFEVKNPTSESQVLCLILYGASGNSYRVALARTPGKKG